MENVSIMLKIYKLCSEVSKMGKLFPNGLFGNNEKYSALCLTLKLMLINLQSIHFQRSPYFRQKFLFLKFSPSLLNSFTIRIGSDGRTDKQDLFLRGYASKNYG